MTDHLPSLTAALSVSTNDILAVTGDAPGDFDLATISLLFRHASLARALGLPIHDLVSLREVSGVDPFASPSDTLRFADIVGRLQAAGIDVPLLLFLLWHRQRPGGRELLSHLCHRQCAEPVAHRAGGHPRADHASVRSWNRRNSRTSRQMSR